MPESRRNSSVSDTLSLPLESDVQVCHLVAIAVVKQGRLCFSQLKGLVPSLHIGSAAPRQPTYGFNGNVYGIKLRSFDIDSEKTR